MSNMVAKPHQIEGARFLAGRSRALLADLPRVGKTGSAIMAADMIAAETILVVTTASGRGVWKAGFAAWSAFDRGVQVLTGGAKLDPRKEVAVVGWGGLTQNKIRAQILGRRWDLILPDEAHYAKNFSTQRTQALYGHLSGADLDTSTAVVRDGGAVWPLTGTPLPNSPADAYPMMRALFPERLTTEYGPTDVTTQDAFTSRYCKMRPMKVGRGCMAQTIQVFVEGRNLAELNARMAGMFLQRAQADVGILEPEYETMPLISPKALPTELVDVKHAAEILAAATAGDGKKLEIHLGPLRRITGMLKAELVADAVKEELDGALAKVVLAYWHKDVGDLLGGALAKYGVVRIDGSTSTTGRSAAVEQFHGKARVILAQIQAAGEAVDLSAAHNLIFVEPSLVPKDMAQMAMRICNHTQKRQPLVRVATLEGSIDDAIQTILMRKWTAIRQTLKGE